MFDEEQVRFFSPSTAADYVVARAGKRPSGASWLRYAPVPAPQAIRIVVEAISGTHSNQRLMRFLRRREHLHELHFAELQRLVTRRFEGIAPPRLYRIERQIAAPVHEVVTIPREELRPATPERPNHYIIVEVATKDGKPAPGIRLEITAPDGATRTLVTDAQGRVSVEGLDAGSCSIALPTVDRTAWTASGAAGQVMRKEAGDLHTVRTGECLSQLAHAYGVRDWQTIWNDSKNDALRQRRKSAHVLMPGDQLYIPGLDVAAVQRPTDATHKIAVDAQPLLVDLVLSFDDFEGEPRGDEPYELSYRADAEVTKKNGTLSGSGELREKIPATLQAATLTFTQTGETLQLELGALNPATDEDDVIADGVEHRLAALGYLRPGANSQSGDATTSALRDFQKLALGRSAATGQLDRETASKLEQLYGV